MKKGLLLALTLCIALGTNAQFTAQLKKNHKAVAPAIIYAPTGFEIPVIGNQQPNNAVSNKSIIVDPITMVTRYDVQSNGSAPIRCYFYPEDHTIGATATWSAQDANWTDRGTGYNYSDGSNWGAQPISRVESIRTGWPNYCRFGPTGELIISHQATGPLVMNTRAVKGTGAWTQTVLPALPTTIPMMFWAKAVTNGPDHTYIHVIALTAPTAYGGLLYNGMDGALVYSRSLDGGATWSAWTQPAGLTSTNYYGFASDTYAFAEPKGDTLAFTLGSGFYDQVLEKSTDNGTTWTRTIIHQSQYNLGGSSPNYFNAPDGACAVALDKDGIAHVIFGLTSDSGSNTTWYYNILAQGIVYWNESMPELRQDLNPDSLIATDNLVGWVVDTSLFSLPPTQIAYWSKSLTSFPTIVTDSCVNQYGVWHSRVFIMFAGATSLLDPNNFNVRHIYGRRGDSYSGEMFWNTDLMDITGDWIQYNFSECMYPSAAPVIQYGYSIAVLFQKDDYGGSYVLSTLASGGWQGQSAPDDNFMTLLNWEIPGLPCNYQAVKEILSKPLLSVTQNVPNPFEGTTEINVYHQNSGDITLQITNITGQTIASQEKTNVLPGVSKFVIDGRSLTPGVYFYTVQQGDQRITKKMIVE